jgi:hypothetical protein
MPKPKGGQGVKAPYTTTHVRVPLPVKPEVERVISRFHESGEIDEEKPLTGVEEAISFAKGILIQKKSAKTSLEKLLTAIYGQKIVL